MRTVRLTVAQATIRFLEAQDVERDGQRTPFFAGCWGIFGHGNVAGLGESLLERELAADPAHPAWPDDASSVITGGESRAAGGVTDGPGAAVGAGAARRDSAVQGACTGELRVRRPLRYLQGRNEQAMVHAAVGFARQRDRLAAQVVTSSVGPGATNMVTGAALATINRLPVLLLPGDTFATKVANPVLQELESESQGDVSVNDAFRPVSAYFDRVHRPQQLVPALLQAMRVLTDPARTGAVTIGLPQDVQAEAADWPEALFAPRVWHVARPVPEPAALRRAVDVIRSSRKPLLIAGGGVIYSGADGVLKAFAEATGTPVAETQAGKGSLPYDHPRAAGAVGATGTTAANRLAAEADVVIGVGTRYSDFTTASRTAFAREGVRFVNLNVSAFDAHKLSAVSLVADAREGLSALQAALGDWTADPDWTARVTHWAQEWDSVVEEAYAREVPDVLVQSAVIGAVNQVSEPQDVVVCAAGSMPGDLHKLWRTRDRKGYHVEYGYSCMGYEIAGGLGVKLAAPEREVFVLVGDGSYLMLSSELVTAVAEGVKLVVVLVQNHGFASIGALSESVGSQRFGTQYRYRSAGTGRLDGARLPVDLAANAASLGADVLTANNRNELLDALQKARRSERTTVVHVETDPLIGAPDSGSWWDVPVAEVSSIGSTRDARAVYEQEKLRQRAHLAPTEGP